MNHPESTQDHGRPSAAPGLTCRIRPLEPGDLDQVRNWRNQLEIRRVMLTHHEITTQEHRRWFAASSVDPSKRLLIVEEGATPIGFVSFSGVQHGGVADWGFYTAPAVPKGSGRKLGKAALDLAFGELQLHKVCGQALAFNTASIRLHRALGFRLEGTLREQHRVDGRHHNLVCFGLLRDEWCACNP
jgi:UDP-4-amino-4,6-dideoxy-N-acetyl-beta-L-altrosamine N-acetyltransferase